MRIAHGDLISGISGDMFVAALLEVGVSLSILESGLKKIPSLRFRLQVSKKTLHGIRATRFRVLADSQEEQRNWREIQSLLRRSPLPSEVKERGLEIFRRLAEVEGKIHGVSPDRVHFHEVGATDSIVDIMAAAIAIHHLKIGSFSFSRVPLGRGLTRSHHGPLPLPAPATLALLKRIPVELTDLEGETVTPTGAAIIATLGSQFGTSPPLTIERIGYGAGDREFPDRPNLFRVILGNSEDPRAREAMVVLETNIDDMNPEIYDYVFERLFQAGALDVFLAPIQMKKNRPGTLLSIIAAPSRREKLAEIIFRETSTIGIRYYPVSRMILKRTSKTLETRFGTVRIKMIEQPDGTTRATPEYEDLKRIAARKKIPLKVLYDEIAGNFKDRPRTKLS
ncbi:MAG: nickel pincer cofactor biosynthesis protein LarC [Candidatus Binatia bacterium]